MDDRYIKLKLPFVDINIASSIKYLKWKAKSDSAAKVALRFLKLFDDHGIAVSQIQSFVPQVTLDKLTSLEALLPVLTNDVLNTVATLFGIRRTWLDGIDDRLYDSAGCYQYPARFFEVLQEIPLDDNLVSLRALYSARQLDKTKHAEQLIALVLTEKIGILGETNIYRYHPLCDIWDWSYDKCRIQLKAMVRLIDTPVPLYRVKCEILHGIYEGTIVPGKYIPERINTNPSLDDYAYAPEEHACAKECDELPWVLQYIENLNLEAVARSAADRRRCQARPATLG